MNKKKILVIVVTVLISAAASAFLWFRWQSTNDENVGCTETRADGSIGLCSGNQ